MMPRLTNKTMTSVSSSGDKLSLRPGSGMTPTLKPSSPHHLPKSTRASNQSPVNVTELVRDSPIFTKPPAVIIKQESRQKNKKQQAGSDGSRASGGQATKQLSDNSKCDKVLKAAESVWTGGGDGESAVDDVCEVFRYGGTKGSLYFCSSSGLFGYTSH